MPDRVRLTTEPVAGQALLPVKNVSDLPWLETGSGNFIGSDGRSLFQPIPAQVVASDSIDAIDFGGSAAVSYDPSTTAFLASLVTPLSPSTQLAIDRLVRSCKALGTWARTDWMLLLASETKEAALKNLVDPSKVASEVNAPGWDQWLGSSGNQGASAHVLLSDPFIYAGSNYTLADAHLGVYCNRNDNNAAAASVGPVTNTTVHYGLAPPGSNEQANLNNGSFTVIRVADVTSGDRTLTRGGADARRGSYNGVIGEVDLGAASTAPTGQACIHRRGTLYGSRRIAIFHFGASLTHAQITGLYAAKRRYLSDIGGLGDAA